MKTNKNGEIYIDFDTYLRQREPSQKEKAYAWSTAIGLQAVDGLTTSKYYSYYFRNALVRANYTEHEKGIDREPIYLERFFRNLLMGEQWVLQSRYLYLDPPEEYKVQPRLDAPASTPSSTPQANLFHTNNENIKRLVLAIDNKQMAVKEMMVAVGLRDRKNFMEYSLNPAMSEGFVCMLYPESPRHPRQKYMLTVKGVGLYNKLSAKEDTI